MWKKLLSLLSVGLMAGVTAHARPPQKQYDIDFQNNKAQFKVESAVLDTPRLRFDFFEGTNKYDASGNTVQFRFSKNDSSSAMTTVTGTVFGTYAIMNVTTSDFLRPVKDWYATLLLTDSTTADNNSFAHGSIDIRRDPSKSATGALRTTIAINGSEYGPFTGSFTNWPFVLSGAFLGGYTEVATFNATSFSFNARIGTNETDIAALQLNDADSVTNLTLVASNAFQWYGGPRNYELAYPTNLSAFTDDIAAGAGSNTLSATMALGNSTPTGIVYTASGGSRMNTSDGSDNKLYRMSGGGSIFDTDRGASVSVYGNEAGTYPGHIRITAGDDVDAKLSFETSNSVVRFFVDRAGNINVLSNTLQNARFGGDTQWLVDNVPYTTGLALGHSATNWGEAYLAGLSMGTLSIISTNASGKAILNNMATENLDTVLARGNTASVSIVVADNILISAGTTNLNDNESFSLAGGGAASSSRGSYIDLAGNEDSLNGSLILGLGDDANSEFVVKGSNSVPAFRVDEVGIYVYSNAVSGLTAPSSASDAATKGYVDSATNSAVQGLGLDEVIATSNIVTTAGIRFANTLGISARTVDGSDSSEIRLVGGGGLTSPDTRGGNILLRGNEASEPGSVIINGGDTNGAQLKLAMGIRIPAITIQTNGDINLNSNLVFQGTLSTGTTWNGNVIATNYLNNAGGYLTGVDAAQLGSQLPAYYSTTNDDIYIKGLTNIALVASNAFGVDAAAGRSHLLTFTYSTNLSTFFNGPGYLLPASTNELYTTITNFDYIKNDGSIPLVSNWNVGGVAATNFTTVGATTYTLDGVAINDWGTSGTMADGSVVANGQVRSIGSGKTNQITEQIIANNTGIQSTKIVNGGFDFNAAGWVLTNCTFQPTGVYSNTIEINAGLVATLTPSNLPVWELVGGVYRIQYMAHYIGGVVTNQIDIGGYEQNHIILGSATQTVYSFIRDTSSTFQLTVRTPDVYGMYVDNISVQRVDDGDLAVGGQAYMGNGTYIDNFLLLGPTANVSVNTADGFDTAGMYLNGGGDLGSDLETRGAGLILLGNDGGGGVGGAGLLYAGNDVTDGFLAFSVSNSATYEMILQQDGDTSFENNEVTNVAAITVNGTRYTTFAASGGGNPVDARAVTGTVDGAWFDFTNINSVAASNLVLDGTFISGVITQIDATAMSMTNAHPGVGTHRGVASVDGGTNLYWKDLNEYYSGETLTVDGVPLVRFDNGIQDLRVAILRELSVGTYTQGYESVSGEGDSHTNYRAFHNTNGTIGSWTDVTADMTSDSGSIGNMFGSTNVGSAIYVGMTNNAFSGVKLLMSTTGSLGSGSVEAQYFNGTVWVAMNIMATLADAPYTAYGNDVFGQAEDQQVRFNFDYTNMVPTNISGYNYCWARYIVTGASIITTPTLEQIKVHTSRTEINADGKVEFFGKAEPLVELSGSSISSAEPSGTGTPADGDIDFSTTITAAGQDNQFNNNATDGLTWFVVVPPGLDTAKTLTFSALMTPDNNVASANMVYHFAYGILTSDSVLAGGNSETLLIRTNSIPLNSAGSQISITVDVEVPTALRGDSIVYTLLRPNGDAWTGNIKIVATALSGYIWK